jgi:hypothetical protein
MSLARITARFIGQPYQLGLVDCFSAVLNYIEEMGYTIPPDFEGQTRTSYAALFADHPAEAKALMVRFIDSLLPEVQPAFAFAGDILLLRLGDSLPFLAIDGGNGTIIAASESRGVGLSSLRKYTVMRAWRCRRQSL